MRFVVGCCKGIGSRLMTAAMVVFGAVLPMTCFGQAAPASQLQALYESHQWFAMRDAAGKTKAPLFYRASGEAAFNQIKPAQKHLNAVIQAAPHSKDAYEAHDMLASLYFRNGLYRRAFLQIDAMLAEKPDAEDVKNGRALFNALKQSDQITYRKKASALQGRMEDGNLFLPITIEGKKAEYIIDSGANFSVMSESEAKRLGLAVQDTDTQTGDSSGAHIGIRVAVAKNIILGGLHLKNVAFGILPDAQEPFVELPEGQRGVLGISVLLAMQTFRWEPGGSCSFGFKPGQRNLSVANLAFDQSFPVTQAGFQNKPVVFTLDTGATNTVLSPPFAKEFPGLLSAGEKESHKLTGVAGSSDYDSVLLPSVTLAVGGRDVKLAPAHVLIKQSSDTSAWAAGNLGIELLNQARTITLDFHAMTLRLE